MDVFGWSRGGAQELLAEAIDGFEESRGAALELLAESTNGFRCRLVLLRCPATRIEAPVKQDTPDMQMFLLKTILRKKHDCMIP